MILILDTVLPIVNRATTDGVIEKVPEGHGSYYVILRHTRMVWSMRHGGNRWVIVERSRGFWVMVQREKKR